MKTTSKATVSYIVLAISIYLALAYISYFTSILTTDETIKNIKSMYSDILIALGFFVIFSAIPIYPLFLKTPYFVKSRGELIYYKNYILITSLSKYLVYLFVNILAILFLAFKILEWWGLGTIVIAIALNISIPYFLFEIIEFKLKLEIDNSKEKGKS